MSSLTLYEMTANIQNLLEKIIDAEIRKDKKEVKALMVQLDTQYESRDKKYVGYIHVIKNSLAAAEACKAEGELFAKRGRALANTAKNLKERLLMDLEINEETEVNAGQFRIVRQKNPQPSLKVSVEAEELPIEYQSVVVDKEALKEALNRGETINGVSLETGEHIRIWVK